MTVFTTITVSSMLSLYLLSHIIWKIFYHAVYQMQTISHKVACSFSIRCGSRSSIMVGPINRAGSVFRQIHHEDSKHITEAEP